MADLIVSGGTVITMDGARRVIPDGAVAVAGGKIAAVGTRAEVEAELGRVLPDTYTAQLRATIDQVFGEHLKPIPHIADTLDRLSHRVCVASSGTPTRIRSSLGTTGLISYFDPHMFSALQVERGKPAPDVYLEAARRLGVEPARCAAVEDSASGIRSAHAAGMRVIAYPNRHYPPAGDVLALTEQVLGAFDELLMNVG